MIHTPSRQAVVTGATGLLGRQVAAQLSRQGWAILALVRPTSDRTLLQLPNLEFHVCDLSQGPPAAEIFQNADLVIHTAAAVTDWAPWPYFVANTIAATRHLCRAMIAGGCRRLVQISTVGVYGRPPTAGPLGEDQPYASMGRWDYYTNSKIQAEQIVWSHQRAGALDVSVVRPALMYGPGDHGLVGRVIPMLRHHQLALVGDPHVLLPLVHVRDVAAATVGAATADAAINEAFNVVSSEPVTQSEFFNTIARLAGAPPVQRRVPYRLAYAAGFAAEIVAHASRTTHGPTISRYRLSLFGHRRCYSTDKIRHKLGWEPTITFSEGIEETVRWHLAHEPGAP